MDYPFYIRKIKQIPDDLLKECLELLDQDKVISHPHFVPSNRNREAYRISSENVSKVVSKVSELLSDVISPSRLYWHEINLLAPLGMLGEHSDLAYAGYNRNAGLPQEIVLTHKIHVHLYGTSSLRFRRSKYEPKNEFCPDVGGCYWYNNYVWHESHNPSPTSNRMALSMIYHDKDWSVRSSILESAGHKFNDCYQL